jgi:DNA-binding transcriptional regulator YiaG
MAAADEIRELIDRAGLSQRQAAEQLGVAQRTFRDWCAGKAEPPKSIILALRYLAGQSPDDPRV